MKRNILLFFLITLFATFAFLRMYKLAEFVTFLGDQGRDAIIIRNILTLKHFPAIGPVTSVGQVYLGPFYYYFMAPWLFFSAFDPIGLAYGSAILSMAFLFLTYLCVRDLFDETTAMVSTILIGFSSVLIEFARFSWNPNLLPYFAFFTVYALVKSVQTSKLKYYLLLGALLSFSIQLHYLALFLIPSVGAVLIAYHFINRSSIKITVRNWVYAAGAFILFSIPLIIFDLRHEFINAKSFATFFTKSGAPLGNFINSLQQTMFFFFSYLLTINNYQFIGYFVFLALLIVIITKYKTHQPAAIISFVSLMLLFGTSLYSGPKYIHYFASLYILYFVMLGYCFAQLSKKRLVLVFCSSLLLIYTYIQIPHYLFLNKEGSKQIAKAKTVSTYIYKSIGTKEYVFTTLPESYGDSVYRYFLELWGKSPIDRESKDTGDELFVVCDKPCKPIGDPLWIIANFAPRKIVSEKQILDVTVYKLIR